MSPPETDCVVLGDMGWLGVKGCDTDTDWDVVPVGDAVATWVGVEALELVEVALKIECSLDDRVALGESV